MIVKINNTTYNMSIEFAKELEQILEPFKVQTVETPTETVKPQKKIENPYTIKGRTLTFNKEVFIPRPVFKGIVATIKDCGGKYQSKTKTWLFDNDTEVKEFLNRQSKYTK